MDEQEVVIVGAARTPVGTHMGTLRTLSAEDLSVLAIQNMEKRFEHEHQIKINKVEIDNLIGSAPLYIDYRSQHIYSANIAHRTGHKDVPSFYIQKICASGYHLVKLASDIIRAGSANAIITFAGESMSNAPFVSQARRKINDVWKPEEEVGLEDYIITGLDHDLFDTAMAKTAQLVGEEHKLDIKQVAEFSSNSHYKASRAQRAQWNRRSDDGEYKRSSLGGVMPINTIDSYGNSVYLWHDEGVRADATIDGIINTPKLMGLDLVRAGTASQVSDGGGAMLIMSEAYAKKLGITPEFFIEGYAEATCDPRRMGMAPIPAIKKYLENSKKKLNSFDVININEAFAPQVLSVQRELDIPDGQLNPLGGAVAIGHPVVATGQIYTTDGMYEIRGQALMNGEDKASLLSTACAGGGQATVLDIGYRRSD